LLCQNSISGAPVVDAQGRCVGVLSAMDFVRLAGRRDAPTAPQSAPRPLTCGFQAQRPDPHGREQTICTLAPGACPVQMKQVDPDGREFLLCSEPHSVLADWQVVEVEKLPTEEVRHTMTADPVTVPPDTAITTLARLMIDAHVHRVIVVDEEHRPVGIVS